MRLRRLGRGGRLLLALAAGGAVFGIATAVQADIPDGGVIHGCVGKPGTTYKGQLRVRDASKGEQCRFYENTLDWNATGVSGATGATGPTGPTGPAGPNNVLTAAVNDLGTLEGGSATAASRPGTGFYRVTFGRDVSNCVANATPGIFHGGSATNDATGLSIIPGGGGNTTVDVLFSESGGVLSNTDFMLIVAC